MQTSKDGAQGLGNRWENDKAVRHSHPVLIQCLFAWWPRWLRLHCTFQVQCKWEGCQLQRLPCLQRVPPAEKGQSLLPGLAACCCCMHPTFHPRASHCPALLLHHPSTCTITNHSQRYCPFLSRPARHGNQATPSVLILARPALRAFHSSLAYTHSAAKPPLPARLSVLDSIHDPFARPIHVIISPHTSHSTLHPSSLRHTINPSSSPIQTSH